MAGERGGVRGRLSSERAIWAGLAGLLALHILLALLLFDPKPFVGGDNAAYMALAESLETGSGYRNIYLPDATRHAQYPPVYPALLAILSLFGGGLIAFKAMSSVFTTASIAFLFLLARGRLGTVGAFAVAVPFALSPLLLYYSHWVLSEAPFVLFILVALWASEQQKISLGWLIAAVAAGLLAYLTRAAGLPLLISFLLVLAWNRQWVRLAWVGGVVGLVVGGWWSWGKFAASSSAQVYESNFLLVNPYAPEQGYVGPGDLLVRVVENLRLYAVDVTPQALAGRQLTGIFVLLGTLTALLLLALAILSWAREVRNPRTLEVFTFFYVGLICLWPQVWTDQRFLLPLLPVLLVYAAGGVVWCFDFVRSSRPVWALPAFGALLALLAVPDDVRAMLQNQSCMKLYRQGDQLACYVPAWRGFVLAADWVRANTPEDAVVVTRKPRLFYYFSSRRGDVYPFTSDDSTMLSFLDDIGADYVVIAGLSQTTFRYLVPVIRSVPEHFVLSHQIRGDSIAAYVLEYRGEADTLREAGEER